MERGGSKTLSALCRMRPKKKLSDNEARYVFKQVVLGVKHIHDNDFCHRDLKMTNILINSNGLVKIIDFGFACKSKNHHSMYCGTPSYMAPEMVMKRQYLGQPLDVWALGVVLYKLLTGEYAFGGECFILLCCPWRILQFQAPILIILKSFLAPFTNVELFFSFQPFLTNFKLNLHFLTWSFPLLDFA